ncbi:MAG: acyltransferase, partial [Pseudomonadales bacterium]|nr:acyltransferase [Pseudomonadales bacterium]
PLLVPYGNTYEMFPLFKLGWLGVQLFFLISGFVIFMTLDKTECFKVYIYKRWLRLFPAMLLASILIYLTAPIFNERPAGEPYILDLLPGLTFIEPSWWSRLVGVKISGLEGAFWSLYVEFKFYVIAGAIYYFLGRRYLVPTLVLLFISSIFISIVSNNSEMRVIHLSEKISSALSLQHFGWFAAGAAFYIYHQSKTEKWFIFALSISLLSSIFVGNLSIYPAIAAIMVSGLFAISLKSALIQNVLTNRILLFLGFISYPLYLIHENAMISMVIKLPAFLSVVPSFFYPIISIFLLSVVSYGIAKKYEILIRRKIEDGFTILTKLNKALQRTSR